MTRSSVEARFWFAPGVEVFPDLRVSALPPSIYRFAIREPLDVRPPAEGYSPEMCSPPQLAQFRLVAWSGSGDVAHYELDSMPPDGWRWLAVDQSIRAERTVGPLSSFPTVSTR